MVDREQTLEELHRTRHAELPLFVVTITPDPARAGDYASDEGRELMRQHLLYWWELEERGVLLGAGPVDVGTPQQSGMAILLTSNRAEAEALATNEPFQRAGWRINTVRPWQLNEGLATPFVRELIEKRGG